MFKIEELSGSLIRSGRFKEAISVFQNEIRLALNAGVITEAEMFNLQFRFCSILLNPSDMFAVNTLSDSMLKLAMRIPGYLPKVTPEEFEKNVKASREAK